MDKLKALGAFISVAEERSFAKAARRLGLSSPSVTRLVGELETDLGVILFHRTTRSVTLTEIGARYLGDAQGIIASLTAADDAARGAHGKPVGILRVTASTMFGALYIPPIVSDFVNEYPDVSVETICLDRVVDIIEEGIDVAIRIGELPDSSLMATRVGSVQLQVCGSPEYFKRNGVPKIPSDLKAHKTIGLTLGNFQSGWRFSNGENLKLKHRLKFNTIPAALAAAKCGHGLVRILSYQIGPELQAKQLQTVLDEFALPPLPIHVVHGPGRLASAKVRCFVDLTVSQLRANQFLS